MSKGDLNSGSGGGEYPFTRNAMGNTRTVSSRLSLGNPVSCSHRIFHRKILAKETYNLRYELGVQKGSGCCEY